MSEQSQRPWSESEVNSVLVGYDCILQVDDNSSATEFAGSESGADNEGDS